MKILITGGLGFIGSHLAENLVKRKHIVSILDNFESNNLKNISPLLRNINLIKGDITDKKIVTKEVKNVDIVFHFAAKVTVTSSTKDKELYEKVNVYGTKLILQAAITNKVKKLVFASSAAVYGNQDFFPICETAKTYPISILGKTKLAGELLIKDAQKKGLDTIIFRLFNVYGPRQNIFFGNVITSFVTNLSKDCHPIIYDGGNQTRDFIYVADIVSACLKSLKQRRTSEYIFNIASGKEYSVNEVLTYVSKMMRKSASPIYKPMRKGDIKRSTACICRAKGQLLFTPSFSLTEGLKRTIPFYIR